VREVTLTLRKPGSSATFGSHGPHPVGAALLPENLKLRDPTNEPALATNDLNIESSHE
jgi:hypothetical protein